MMLRFQSLVWWIRGFKSLMDSTGTMFVKQVSILGLVDKGF